MSDEQRGSESLTVRRAKSPISFDVVVDRLEISRNFGDEYSESLEWSLSLHPLKMKKRKDSLEPANARPNYLLVGHLFRSCEEGTAQVRANGIIRAYEADGQDIEPHRMVAGLAHGFAEPIYDACRRSLELQAANMDTSLGLPIAAPATEIELHE